MAKKPKKEAAPEAGAEGSEAAASAAKGAAPKSKKKLVIVGAAVVVLLGAGGGGYMMLKKPHGEGAEAKEEVAKPVAFVDIREMTVNLAPDASQDHQRFLKFRVALEVKDAKTAAEIQPLLPRVEDSFQVFVRELRVSDLDGSAGLYRLREELVRRVNIAVHPAKVDAVLFKDIVVQ
jgi:flagellar FliL protein